MNNMNYEKLKKELRKVIINFCSEKDIKQDDTYNIKYNLNLKMNKIKKVVNVEVNIK